MTLCNLTLLRREAEDTDFMSVLMFNINIIFSFFYKKKNHCTAFFYQLRNMSKIKPFLSAKNLETVIHHFMCWLL